jgi:hypothetical protein
LERKLQWTKNRNQNIMEGDWTTQKRLSMLLIFNIPKLKAWFKNHNPIRTYLKYNLEEIVESRSRKMVDTLRATTRGKRQRPWGWNQINIFISIDIQRLKLSLFSSLLQ